MAQPGACPRLQRLVWASATKADSMRWDICRYRTDFQKHPAGARNVVAGDYPGSRLCGHATQS